eukprot:g8719.t1
MAICNMLRTASCSLKSGLIFLFVQHCYVDVVEGRFGLTHPDLRTPGTSSRLFGDLPLDFGAPSSAARAPKKNDDDDILLADEISALQRRELAYGSARKKEEEEENPKLDIARHNKRLVRWVARGEWVVGFEACDRCEMQDNAVYCFDFGDRDRLKLLFHPTSVTFAVRKSHGC